MDMNIFEGIKVVLWDIDGTVFDFFEAQKNAIRALFKQFNLGECDDEMLMDYDSINHKYWKALERGEITKPQVLTGRFIEFFGKYNMDVSIVEAFNDEYQVRLGDTVSFFPGVLDTINTLKAAGILQCAVTNGTKIAQQRKLSKSGLDQILDGIFISEDVGFEKPNPRFFEAVYDMITKERGEVNLSEIMIVGDSLSSDIKFGNNVGIKTCWFNHAGEVNSNLRVDYEIDNFIHNV